MIQSLLRSIEVLGVLKDKESCTIAQIVEELNLPPSTVHRILKTLCSEKYVVKDGESHYYMLGPALISLGSAASKNIHLQKIAYPILKMLVSLTGEDTFLVIPVGNKGIVLERIDGPRTLKIVEEFGDELYLHYGAIRRAILAYQDENFIDMYIKKIIEGKKNKLKMTGDQLLKKLEKIRKDGISTSSGDYVKGTMGIAAPIFNSNGKVISSIGIVVLRNKNLTEERIGFLKEIVKLKGQELSKCMGYYEKI